MIVNIQTKQSVEKIIERKLKTNIEIIYREIDNLNMRMEKIEDTMKTIEFRLGRIIDGQ